MDDGAVVGAAKITDVGAQQFIGAQPGQQRDQDQGAVTFDPVAASPGLRVRVEGPEERGHRACRQCLRQRLRELGPAHQRHRVGRDQPRGVQKSTQHIPGRPAALNRRRFMGFGDCANAVRIESVVMSPNDIRDRSLVSSPAMRAAIASQSWR